jgi:CRP-like cAMP-binding protein/Fe-S-cluster-containing hydrogenase component 2
MVDAPPLAALEAALQRIPGFEKTRVHDLLSRVPLFAGVSEGDLAALTVGATLHQAPSNTAVIRQGEFEETFFIILSGAVQVTAEEADAPLSRLGPGEFFGEMAALTGYPRSATVTTAEPSLLLEVIKEAFLALVDRSPTVKARVDREYVERSLNNQLRRIPLFADLDTSALDELRTKAILRTFKKGEEVFREGEPGDSFYVVRNGFGKVSRQKGGEEFVINYLKGGTYFGEMALVGNEPRTAGVMAVTRMEVVQFRREDFLGILERYPGVAAKVRREIEERKQWQQRLLQNVTLATTLKGFVEGGVIGGSQVLMIDLKKCIRCYNCVRACSEVHEDGHSRVNLKGMKVGSLLIATSCRHCYNPECMVCPIGAIGREPSGRVEIKSSCMGIGKCAKGCPYGVISMVSVDQIKRPQGWWGRFTDRFKKPRLPKPDPAGPDPTALARLSRRKRYSIKCDLCEGFPGPACERNCPTGAAQRLNPQEYLRYLERSIP